MTKFGPQWKDWGAKIFKDWDERVAPEDIVLIGGDNAWPTQAYIPSMRKVSGRPGKKFWIEGNHCKWVRQQIGGSNLDKFRKETKDMFEGYITRIDKDVANQDRPALEVIQEELLKKVTNQANKDAN